MERSLPSRNPSRRFLAPEELAGRGSLRPASGQPFGCSNHVFAEGQWQTIRLQLEQEGWNPSQIDLVHGQLRQGWPLTLARQIVARLSGHCPIRARSDR
jgi:hypothetical protein